MKRLSMSVRAMTNNGSLVRRSLSLQSVKALASKAGGAQGAETGAGGREAEAGAAEPRASAAASALCDFRCVTVEFMLDFCARVLSGELALNVQLYTFKSELELPIGAGAGGSRTDARVRRVASGATAMCKGVAQDGRLILLVPFGSGVGGSDEVLVKSELVRPKARAEWDMEDVCEYVVRRGARGGGSFTSEVLAKKHPAALTKPLQGFVVVHSRSTRLVDLARAVQAHFEEGSHHGASWVMSVGGRRRPAVWLDVFGADQTSHASVSRSTGGGDGDSGDRPASGSGSGELNPAEPDEERSSKSGSGAAPAPAQSWEQRKALFLSRELMSATRRFEGCLVVLPSLSRPVPLSRAWCLWELYCAAAGGLSVQLLVAEGPVSAAYLEPEALLLIGPSSVLGRGHGQQEPESNHDAVSPRQLLEQDQTVLRAIDEVLEHAVHARLDGAECESPADLLALAQAARAQRGGTDAVEARVQDLLLSWLLETLEQRAARIAAFHARVEGGLPAQLREALSSASVQLQALGLGPDVPRAAELGVPVVLNDRGAQQVILDGAKASNHEIKVLRLAHVCERIAVIMQRQGRSGQDIENTVERLGLRISPVKESDFQQRMRRNVASANKQKGTNAGDASGGGARDGGPDNALRAISNIVAECNPDAKWELMAASPGKGVVGGGGGSSSNNNSVDADRDLKAKGGDSTAAELRSPRLPPPLVTAGANKLKDKKAGGEALPRGSLRSSKGSLGSLSLSSGGPATAAGSHSSLGSVNAGSSASSLMGLDGKSTTGHLRRMERKAQALLAAARTVIDQDGDADAAATSLRGALDALQSAANPGAAPPSPVASARPKSGAADEPEMLAEAAAAQLAAGYQAPSRESLELFVAVQAQLAALPTTEMEAATQRLLAAEAAVRRFQLPEDAGLKEDRRRPAWLSDLLVEALTTLAAHHADSLRRQEQGRQGEGGGDDKARGARRQARAAKRNAAVDCLVEARELVIKRVEISSMDAAVIRRLAAIERELAAALHRRDGPTLDALSKLQWSLTNLRRVEKLERQLADLEPATSEQRLARESAVEELQWPIADTLSEVAAMSCALGLDESLFRAMEALEAWEAVVAADDEARDADEPPRSRGDARERLGEVNCLLAALHDEAGRLAESQRRYQRAVEALAASKGLGANSLREAEATYNYACVVLKMGEPEEALKLFERALRLFQLPRDAQGTALAGSRASAQPRHCIEAGLTLTNMSIGHEMLREWSAALAACEEAVQEYQMVLGKDHEQTCKLAKKCDRLRKKVETGGAMG